jgi:hypothetical protein
VEFEPRINAGNERLYVSLVERVKYPAVQLDVLLRHRFSLFRVAGSAYPAAAPREQQQRTAADSRARDGVDSHLEFTVVFTVRKGKVGHIEFFWDHPEALETMGVPTQTD